MSAYFSVVVSDSKNVKSFGEIFHAVSCGYDEELGDDGSTAPMHRIASSVAFHPNAHLCSFQFEAYR